jgi:hypothetical protein
LGGIGIWTEDFALTKQTFYSLSHTSSPFCSGYFGDGISWTICPGWLQTMILLISASQVSRIIGMSHQCPAFYLFIFYILEEVWSFIFVRQVLYNLTHASSPF